MDEGRDSPFPSRSKTAVIAETLRRSARDCDRRADELRAMADKIEHPPEGVTVHVDLLRGKVTFIGPAVETVVL